jgi:hypothetical protein
MVSLDEAEHFSDNQKASVATLRWCSASARNAVRLPFGISVRLRRNPQPVTTATPSINTANLQVRLTKFRLAYGPTRRVRWARA